MKRRLSVFTLFIVFLISGSLFALDHFTESFENPDTWSSYTTGTVTFDSGAWEFVSVYPEASTQSQDGSKACRINDDTAGASITAPAVNTVGSISFYYHRPFSGTGSFILQKSTDGGANFTDLDTVNYDNVTTPTLYSFNVNDASASVIMRILNDDNTAHLTIDLVTISDFGGVVNPVVNLSLSSNTATENFGSVVTVTASTDIAVTGDQTVDVAVTGSNITGDDYVLSNTFITISDGTTSGIVTFTVSDDTVFEGNEYATIAISNPSAGLSLGSTLSDVVTITDNDTPTLPLTEDFESQTLGVFTAFSSASNKDWETATYSSNYYAYVNGYQGDENSNDWLIAPALDLTGATYPQITFDNAKNYTGPDLELVVSVDYDGTSDPSLQGNWTPLPFTMSAGSWAWVSSGAIDLSAFSSPATYIAFHYTSDSNAAGWEIDNVVIEDGDDPLPVTLSSFNCIVTNSKFVELNWVTKSETEMEGYYIYRNDKDDLDNAVCINSSIIAASNSGSGADYTFTDIDVIEDDTYFYWLESVSITGNVEFFGPANVTVTNGNNGDAPEVCKITELKSAYPNPFNPETTINFSIKDGETGNLVIFNLKGQIVKSYNDFHEGTHEVKWYGKDNNGSKAASGTYFYKLSTSSTSVTKKLILMK